jgi:hypothetical protein
VILVDYQKEKKKKSDLGPIQSGLVAFFQLYHFGQFGKSKDSNSTRWVWAVQFGPVF